jgi:ABC-type hemin transport system ATPase subunit
VTDDDVRDEIISARVTRAEKELFQARRREECFATDSAFFRYLAGFDKQRVSMAARLAELEKQVQQLTNNRKG